MSGLAGELHNQYGGAWAESEDPIGETVGSRTLAWNFTNDSIECKLELLNGIDSSNTLPSATLTGLDHHREADLLGTLETFLDARHAGFLVDIVGDNDVALI